MLAEFGTGQVFWSFLWFFIFIIWIYLLIFIFSDIFRSRDLSGWGKALWSIFIIVVPYLGIFVYLIVRGHSMADRQIAQAQAQQEAMDSYIKTTASSGVVRRSVGQVGRSPHERQDRRRRVRGGQGQGSAGLIHSGPRPLTECRRPWTRPSQRLIPATAQQPSRVSPRRRLAPVWPVVRDGEPMNDR